MRKSYEAHEYEYRKMKSHKIKSWSRRNYPWSISPPDKHFLEDIFIQSWAPKKGQAIELGCGTGTISRWLTKKGFIVTGIDVSQTAIKMAKAQSKGLKIKYINDDFYLIDTKPLGKYNLCIDGQFLHCITDKKDRKTVLSKIRQILNPGGVFVVMSMCFPVSHKNFAKTYTTQKILGNVIYIEAEKYGEFQGLRIIQGKKYIPTRYIAHWKVLLSELKNAGFYPMIIKYFIHDKNTPEEPTSYLNVAAIRE
ncbi:MAG: class I SAM-dependent methyltransferase [Candidatus Omnitrophica bacterium]|nr:class I SAM-dependent methyltransferase [Candidatus Omnitrophota bacterium]MBU1889561.1 class I SAM-dependent methyltransferase [Candidatus Omnitrophota bacterium]